MTKSTRHCAAMGYLRTPTLYNRMSELARRADGVDPLHVVGRVEAMVSSAGGGDQTLVLVQIKCAWMDAREVSGRTDDVRQESGKFDRCGPIEYNNAVRARSSMDRASDFESAGWGFESLRARLNSQRRSCPLGVCVLVGLRRADLCPLRHLRSPSLPLNNCTHRFDKGRAQAET